ncbi:hypothetical protein BGZ94_002043 [Podila epigama]|nr:hypothetical protein BGZ94_002043 [Podila epigama]
MANTMKFGPEWMRRFPAKTTQPANDLLPRAPSPVQDAWGQPTSSQQHQHQHQHQQQHQQQQPLQQHHQSAQSTGHPGSAPAFSYSSVAANNVRSQNGPSSIEPVHLDSTPSDTLNPFKYSKELMLSLYKPVGFPIEFERHEYATSEEALQPMSSQPFSDQEIKILSGSVNSEVARRVVQPGEGPQDRPQGQRRESLSNNDKEREYSGRHDRSDRASHSRNHDSKYQGSNIRTRHMNNEDRSHSFKRSEQQQTPREQDDGLWNSPVRNTVGSFDSNGVFRVSHEGEALGTSLELEETPEEEKEEGEPVADPSSALPTDESLGELKEAKESPTGSTHSGQDFAAPSDHGSEKHDASSSIINGLDDKFSFSNSGLGSSATKPSNPPEERDETEFVPFSSAGSSNFNSGPAFDTLPIELSKWLYRDPSGSVQGPFSSEDMHEWYKGGFFSMDLLVKREQDPTFEPLGQLIRRIGSDDKPFLLAGIVRPEIPAAPIVRPNMTLPQGGRQGLGHFNHSSWGGLSAPSTPGTPSFGVDRLFLQQQQQSQLPTSDVFGGQQPGSEFGPSQEHGGFPGYEQKWNAGGLFGGPVQGMGGSGWAGDAFPRSPMANVSGPQAPLGGDYLTQQRLLAQQLERQQYFQMLQRQSHMQQIMHQQQFLAAQQQFGNDPHALAALLSQQQAQQRQLQMRQQQLQQFGFHHGPNVSTPGGSAMPWGGLGQPSSPWSSSIIQPSSDNYFDANNGEVNNVPHAMQHQQQNQNQHQTLQQQQHQQHQQQQQQAVHNDQGVDALNHESHVSQHGQNSSQLEEKIQSVTEQIHDLTVDNSSVDTGKQGVEDVSPAVQTLEEKKSDETDAFAKDHAVKSDDDYVHAQAPVEETKDQFKVEAVKEEKKAEEEKKKKAEEEKKKKAEEEEKKKAEKEKEKEQVSSKAISSNWDTPVGSTWATPVKDVSDNGWESPSEAPKEDAWGTPVHASAQEDNWSNAAAPEPRIIKSVPAPWAKSAEEDAPERKGPSLREIQEMEAKKAEEQRAAERQAQQAAAASGLLDFTKGMSGASPWQTASAPKKKTLREILQEEEAALEKARASQAVAAAAASPPPSSNTSTGLAAIVAGNAGSAGKRYADTIGPKPTPVINSGPWGSSSSSAAAVVAKPVSIGRATSSHVATSSVSRPTVDNSWIEVDNKRGKPSAAAPVAEPVIRSAPSSHTNNNSYKNSSQSDEPRAASEEFLHWCRQALKGLQDVVLEDFIQMLLSFPLNPDPMTVEIIQDSIYAHSKSLDGRRFADEFIRRRKADAYPNSPAAQLVGSSSSSLNSAQNHHSGADSFKVVSKKGRKKGTA